MQRRFQGVTLLLLSIAGICSATETLEQNPCGMDMADQIEFDVLVNGATTGAVAIANVSSLERVFEGGDGIGRQMQCRWGQIFLQTAPGTGRIFASAADLYADRCAPCDGRKFQLMFYGRGQASEFSMTVSGRRIAGRKARVKAWSTSYQDSDWLVSAHAECGRTQFPGARSLTTRIDLRQRLEPMSLAGHLPSANDDDPDSTHGDFTEVAELAATSMHGLPDSRAVVIRQVPLAVRVSGTLTGEYVLADFVLVPGQGRWSYWSAVLFMQDQTARKTWVGLARHQILSVVSLTDTAFVVSGNGLEFRGELGVTRSGHAPKWIVRAEGTPEMVEWDEAPTKPGEAPYRTGHAGHFSLSLEPLLNRVEIVYPETTRYIRKSDGITWSGFH